MHAQGDILLFRFDLKKFRSSNEKVSFAAVREEYENHAIRICEARKSYDVSVYRLGDAFLFSFMSEKFDYSDEGVNFATGGWNTKIVRFSLHERRGFFSHPPFSKNSFTLTRVCVFKPRIQSTKIMRCIFQKH